MRGLGAALLVLLSGSAWAGEARELQIDPLGDGIATASLGAAWIGSELLKSRLAPPGCRWCDEVPGIDQTVRDRWKWGDTARADRESSELDFVALPVLMLGADAALAGAGGSLSDAPKDGLIILEAAVAASALNQVVKFAVARERPFVHALPAGQKALTADPADNDLSFYSGHTTLAFALVAATGTVATLRGYRGAWLVWPVGGFMAATVGYLRIAADKHWASDVATGAILGSATGVLLPLLLHPAQASPGGVRVIVTPSVSERAPVFALSFVF